MAFPKWPVSTERELELLREILDSPQWGGYHELVSQFEREFAAFQHCTQGVSAANGSVSLEMALVAAGVSPGDEVIVPAISFISTATAVSRVGAVPVFVDIEPLSFNIDPIRAAAALTPKTKALIAVHFGGPMADMDHLVELAKIGGLALIEDAAHAHGSEWNGRRAGSFGIAGSFSFQNSKVMTAGEGGLIATNDAEFAARVRSLGDQGRRPDGGWFDHYILGTNFRLTGFQAAVLLAQLERLPGQIALRSRNAGVLRAALAEVKGLMLQDVPEQVTANSWYLFLGRIDAAELGMNRDSFHKALTAQEIPCTPFYPHPLYKNPVFATLPHRVEPCPNAEASISDAFWLPHRVLMGTPQDMQVLAELIVRCSEKGLARLP
ncbi:MAG: DegT/DnrJ/EryC1/StrS family aminotransferase [Bryobacteraceae bacterium]